MSKKKWPELGVITKNEITDKDGKVVTDDKGNTQYRLGFKLDRSVTVLVDGEPVALNKSKTGFLTNPVDEVEKLYKLGVIKDEDIESRRDKAKEISSWLRYKVTLPPPRD